MDPKVTVRGAIGAGIGVVQTPLLREFVDRKYPATNIPYLKTFGTPSALAGIIGGGTVLAIGVIGASRGKDGRQRLPDNYVEPAIDYGVTAILGGLLSGFYPAVTQSDCVAAKGYWYDGTCHKTPAAALSMQNQPGIQTATSYTYKPPLLASQGPDMDVMKQMSSEMQRLSQAVNALSQENAALRAQTQAPAIEVAQVIPGPVASRQARYGFMEGGLETNQPLRKTEQIRKKFDFMG